MPTTEGLCAEVAQCGDSPVIPSHRVKYADSIAGLAAPDSATSSSAIATSIADDSVAGYLLIYPHFSLPRQRRRQFSANSLADSLAKSI